MGERETVSQSPAVLIAEYLERAKIGLLAHWSSFVVLAHPSVVTDTYRALSGQPGPIPLVVKRSDGSVYPTPSLDQVLEDASRLPGFGFGQDLFTFTLRAISVKVGDELGDASLYREEVPLLQFVRHLRNASAHDNRWNFQEGQPRSPAEFRSLALKSEMHGQRVFLEYLSVGDFLDLADDLILYLRDVG